MRRLLLLSFLLLAGCDNSAPPVQLFANKDIPMDPLNDIKARLAFTCVHETITPASAESEMLFKYARWLQKGNLFKQDATVNAQVERLYRIAAENGDYKATINLQNGALRGQFNVTSAELRRFSQQLIDAKVGSGYYFIGMYLEHGAAGLKQDTEMALRYYRKAADEGSPLAQAYVAEKLFIAGTAYDVAEQMRRCAAEQGEGKAAMALGINLKGQKRYKEALEAFQLGVAAGDETSASFLESGFESSDPSDQLNYLGQHKDEERARRYEAIGKILGDYSYVNPKVPEIDEIVPLPPAPLPAWDGKLKWLEEHKANVPPEKPSEALIAQLARAKQLNPATGKPLPESPDFDKHSVAKLLCRSGESCPKSGYWQIAWLPHVGVSKEEVLLLKEGSIMPTDIVERVYPRPWPLQDKRVQEEQWVDWRFLGEA